MEEIQRLWSSFAKEPFSSGDKEDQMVDLHIDLVLCEGGVAGCVQTFIHRKGRLDNGRISILKKCVDDLKVLEKLSREYHPRYKDYITRLLFVADKLLKAVE